MNHHQTGSHADQTEHNVQLLEHEANQAGGDEEHTTEGGDDHTDHVDRVHIITNEQHDGAVRKDVGNDKGGDGQTGGIERSLHGRRLGNGRASIGSQGHGGRNVGHDAEVEHEEVSGQDRQTHLDQDRRTGGGHDDVVGGGRYAHTQDHAADHGQDQRDDQVSARNAHDGVDQDLTQAGVGHHAGDDAGHAAGHAHGQGALSATLKGVDISADILHIGLADQVAGHHQHEEDPEADQSECLLHLQRISEGGNDVRQIDLAQRIDQQGDRRDHHHKLLGTSFPVGHAGHDGYQAGDNGAVRHGEGPALNDHEHQDDQGQQKIKLGEDVLALGQGIFVQALQADGFGLEVDHQEDAGEIQGGRQDGAHQDVGVLSIRHLSHQEGRSAQDGGHDLTAGGSGRLDGAGKLGGIAGPLHQGDGDRAGGHGVAHGGAGHHAAQGGGNDSHLSGAAGGRAGDAVGAVNKERSDTGGLQEGSEQHEQEDVRGADLDGGTDDAVGGIDQVIDGALKGLVSTHRQQGVGHKGGRHNDDGDADDPAAGLYQHQDRNDADDNLGGADAAAHGDQLFFEDDLIEINANCHHKQDNVVNRNMIGLELHILFDGVHDEDKRQYDAQEETAAHAALPGGKHTDPDHRQHE